MDRIKQLWAALQRTRLWRAWKRYGDARGNLLAGGVTYFAFFSIFPAVALAFTVFGILLQDNPQWLGQIRDYLNDTLPGFIDDGSGNGLIPLSTPSGDTLTITGLVGVAGLLWAGLGWLGALRDGIRAVFGAEGEPGNFVTNKLRDLGVLLLLGLAIVVSAAITGIAGAATSWIADQIGLGGQAWLLSLVAFVVGAFLDGLVVLVMLRLLSGVDVPWRGLVSGAVVGGVGLTLLKVLGTTLIAGTTRNPLFTSIALVVGLLAWLNFMSRIILLAAAWSANSLEPQAVADLSEGQRVKLTEGPELPRHAHIPPESNPATRHADAVVVPPASRAEDRVNLALGAALGASAAAGLGIAGRALRRITSRR
ncbi:YihY/virulence factor BrkB family protein [Knoellia subterranea]|uniref:YihY/virulence factor BrkB family protein n=1 Tax=Knoellia subterranea TaxID=184882 RepID=UPI00055A01F8|nr:YihY/virulence factor BrkB family protein [Knoellia subterranea]